MRSDLLSQERARGWHCPWPQKKGNKMEDTIKNLSLEELLQIVKLAQKEIDRRTIKRVEVS
jgi:hypothetical protein